MPILKLGMAKELLINTVLNILMYVYDKFSWPLIENNKLEIKRIYFVC